MPIEVKILASIIPRAARRKLTRMVAAALLCCGSAGASGPMTEAKVIELAGAHGPSSAVAAAVDSLATARTRTAGLLPNPSLSWDREAVVTAPAGGQDIFRATLPLDFSRPGAKRALAATDGAWMRVEASSLRIAGILEAVFAYYDVVLAQQRVQLLSRSVENLEEAHRVLRTREAAGSASGYETARLAIESELTLSRHAGAKGDLASAKARLAALLAVEAETIEVPASLSLLTASEEQRISGVGASGQPTLKLASISARLAGEAEDRAQWTWLPSLELGAGMKHVNGGQRGYGYVVGLAVTLPLFDHGQALREEAKAVSALSTARVSSLERGMNGELQSSLASFRSARLELERFEEQTAGRVDTLLQAVRSGYREGERTIVELLDAQRAQTDVAERRIDLLGEAKRAEARLRAAAGDLK